MNIRIIDIESKETYTIDLTGVGNEKKSTCPVCSSSRKKFKDKVLSYNLEKDSAYCHHCERSFVKFINSPQKQKEYIKPVWKNTTDLNDKTVKFFESRKISQQILKNLRITCNREYMPQFNKEVDTIQFNYFLNNELINIKYRGPKKSFKLYKDSERILYNIDSIKDTKECIIVEGEIDCLSFIQSGRQDVVSVPNGAGKNTEYLDNYLDYFDNKEVIYLATDNDIKGVELRNELARRLGLEKCKKVDFRGCKDANEYHIKHGGESLLKCLELAKDYKIEGLLNVKDIESEYFSLFNNGLKKGKTIGGNIDDFISFQEGRLYTITGIPNHGKSNWLDFVIMKLALKYNIKFAYFSPENQPLQLHAATLTEKLTGKKFDNKHTELKKIEQAYNYLKNNFWFINPPDKFTIDNILELAKAAIKKHGVQGIVIDPYNKIEHQFDYKTTETNYISQLLDKLTTFSIKNNILTFLVAHPRKMGKDRETGLHEIPTLYDINGSANFYNKTDFGITVYRNLKTGISTIYIQKAKFRHLGTIGCVEQRYNINNQRYSDMDNLTGNVIFDNDNWLDQINNEFADIDDNEFESNINFEKEELPF